MARQKSPCLNCGAMVNTLAAIYCSQECSIEFVRMGRIICWLETGSLKIGQTSRVPEYIRHYLYKEQDNCCAICHIDRIWNGKDIVFISDHIDGNSSNNNRSNLRMICPNCDSQLPTFKARNKGYGRKYRRDKYLKDRL